MALEKSEVSQEMLVIDVNYAEQNTMDKKIIITILHTLKKELNLIESGMNLAKEKKHEFSLIDIKRLKEVTSLALEVILELKSKGGENNGK